MLICLAFPKEVSQITRSAGSAFQSIALKENRSAFGTVSHHLHRQRRSAVKTFVSKKTVQTFQASICLTVESLCKEFKHLATTGEIFECSIFFLCWATDSVSKYLENETYGLLDDEQRRKDWQRTINKVVELTPIVKQYPFFMPFLFKVPPWMIRLISSDMDLVLLMHKVREKHFLSISQRPNSCHSYHNSCMTVFK